MLEMEQAAPHTEASTTQYVILYFFLYCKGLKILSYKLNTRKTDDDKILMMTTTTGVVMSAHNNYYTHIHT